MRWAGKLGRSQQTEVKPGIWEDVITEDSALGELKQRTEALDSGDQVLPQYRTTTSVSVLAAGHAARDDVIYLTIRGIPWKVSSTVHEYPRLVYFIGEEYHGPLPS